MIEFKLTRKNIKNIHLYVRSPDGRVEVTAPVRVSEARVRAFVESKAAWIAAQQERIAASGLQRPLTDADRSALRAELAALVPKWSAVTGLVPSGWTIRSMRPRWGSCNTRTGHINFALQLAQTSPQFREYVVLHELIHLRVPGHGPDFKAELDRYMPNWREVRRSQKDF